MAITIDHNVPFPNKAERFPFADMQVGDSFLIPGDESRQQVRAAAINYGNKSGQVFKVTIRRTDAGLRCWRIA